MTKPKKALKQGILVISHFLRWNMDTKAFNRRYLRDCLARRDLYSRGIIEEAYRNNTEEAALLPIEKINGSVLFISGRQDGMCPASESSVFMMKRLKANEFQYSFEHFDYEHLGHFILPFKPCISKLLIAERRYPKECDAERAQAWNSILDFLRNKWLQGYKKDIWSSFPSCGELVMAKRSVKQGLRNLEVWEDDRNIIAKSYILD